jgi:sialate O-acetylesterase
MNKIRWQQLFIIAMIVQWLVAPGLGEAANLSLPTIFSSHMVIQRDKPIHIWGKADVGEQIRVEFASRSATTVATAGHWEVWLDPVSAGGPYELLIVGERQQKRLQNVLVGDVWVASGQSNMVTNLQTVISGNDAISLAHRQEAANLANSQIRLFQPAIVSNRVPLSDYNSSGWSVGSLDGASSFSAVGFFFGGYLQQALDVPIGIIQLARGGSPAQAWMPLEAFETSPALQQIKAMTEELETNDYNQPAALYNGLIAPAHNFPVKGVIWYQGERNATLYHTTDYVEVMTALINSWRQKWQDQLPFLIVQLPAYGINNNTWPYLRDAQRKVALTNDDVGLAVTIDTGDRSDIHPKNKMPVGYRLALQARSLVYGEDIVSSGPTIDRAEGIGNDVLLTFSNIGSGLMSKSEELAGFCLCDADGKCVRADAMIEGQQVMAWTDAIERPASVTYAWSDFPEVSLFNVEGLPAAPFHVAIDYSSEANASDIKVMRYPITRGGRSAPFVLVGTTPIGVDGLQHDEKLVVSLQEVGDTATEAAMTASSSSQVLFTLTPVENQLSFDSRQVADGIYNLVFELEGVTETGVTSKALAVICNNTPLEDYLPQLPEFGGVTGLSGVVVEGRPLGRVRLVKPPEGDILAGDLSIEYSGVHPMVTRQVDITLTPAYLFNGSDDANSSMSIYSGTSVPDHLVYDTTQIADGAYDLEFKVALIDGQIVTHKRRIAIDNWTLLEDAAQPPQDSWFGEIKRMQTVATTTGWEFTGDAQHTLFDDADRIRRKAATEESLIWKLSRLHSFAFTVYTSNVQFASAIRIGLSSDGATWSAGSYSVRIIEQSPSGWWKVMVEGAVPPDAKVNYIRFTITGDQVAPAELELGKVVLTGLSGL